MQPVKNIINQSRVEDLLIFLQDLQKKDYPVLLQHFDILKDGLRQLTPSEGVRTALGDLVNSVSEFSQIIKSEQLILLPFMTDKVKSTKKDLSLDHAFMLLHEKYWKCIKWMDKVLQEMYRLFPEGNEPISHESEKLLVELHALEERKSKKFFGLYTNVG